MRAVFSPSRASGTVSAPPSKSFAHRLLICAALADGESRIERISESDDIAATLTCLRTLGTRINVSESGSAAVRGFDRSVVRGSGRRFDLPSLPLVCYESGSTLRFLIPLAMSLKGKTVFTGTERLLSRPLGVYEKIAEEQGLTFSRSARSLTVCGGLRPGNFVISGAESSQFASGLLFALPLLHGDSTLTVLPPVTSAPYIEMTLSVLRLFGIRIERKKAYSYFVPGDQTYRSASVTVEGDWSNAAALLALSPDVTVTGLDPDSLQGDKIAVRHLAALRNGTPTIDLTDCPDLGPVLFAVAALESGAVFTGTERLRGKESDRVAAMEEELRKCGAALSIGENRVAVPGGQLRAPSVPLSSHNDHRIVMALSVILSRFGGVLEGAEAVSKSFPAYYDTLKALGLSVSLL